MKKETRDEIVKHIIIFVAVIVMITVTVAFGYRTYLEFFV